MILLDYTLPRASRYILFLDMPFRYSSRHLIAYFHNRIIRKKTKINYLTKSEERIHFCIAFLEVLPLLGMVVALIDRMLFAKSLAPIKHYSKEDKKVASFMLTRLIPVYSAIYGKKIHFPYVLGRYVDEMKAIANMTETSFEEVLHANCLFDRMAIFAGSKEQSTQETIAALKFDGKKKKLYYSFASNHAPDRTYKCYNLSWLLQEECTIYFEHHIDVPMALLAPFTRLFVHDTYVFVGWLGLIGTYFGINKHGLILAASSIVVQSKEGTPNQLLFRQILEEAKNVKDAVAMLDKSTCSASMHVQLAARDGKISYDLNR